MTIWKLRVCFLLTGKGTIRNVVTGWESIFLSSVLLFLTRCECQTRPGLPSLHPRYTLLLLLRWVVLILYMENSSLSFRTIWWLPLLKHLYGQPDLKWTTCSSSFHLQAHTLKMRTLICHILGSQHRGRRVAISCSRTPPKQSVSSASSLNVPLYQR